MSKTSTIIISLDSFSLDMYVIKEMTLVMFGGVYEHFIFAPPSSYADLTAHQKKTVTYTTRYLNELRWGDGELPYYVLFSILKKIVPGTEVICHGNMARIFLQAVVPEGVTMRDTSLDGGK